MFRHLKTEILAFTLGLTIITIIVTTIFGVFSIRSAGTDAEEATSMVLREQSKDILIQIAKASAERQDILFEGTRNEARHLAAYTQNVYDNPSVFDRSYWRYSNRVYREGERYLNRESDVSTIFIPQYTVVDAQEIARMELSASLDFIAPSILAQNADSVAVYTIDPKGFSRYYPNIVLGNVAPPEHSTLDDIVYIQGTPEENPEKKVVWSPLYDDPAQRGLMITATAPIYTENGFEGTIGIDVLLNDIIKNITSYSPIEGSYAFLVDTTGTTIAFPNQAYEDILNRQPKEGETRVDLTESDYSFEFAAIFDAMMRGEEGVGFIHRGDKELFIAYAPLIETGFSMAVVAESDELLKVVTSLHNQISDSIQEDIFTQILPVSVAIIVIASFIGILLVSRIVQPVQELTVGAEEIGKGNFDYNLTVKSENEIGVLAKTFAQMSKALKKSRQELQEYSEGLEKKVAERTKELTQANKRLTELDKLKSEFVSLASHQMRAPLTSIKGYASLILDGTYGRISKDVREGTERIFESSNAMVRAVEDFLNVSRIEQGEMKYDFAKGDFAELAESITKRMKPVADKKGLTIKCKGCPENMPVHMDAYKMEQVLTNLIDNAIKYTPKGEIIVAASKEGKMARISVADSGVGLSKEAIGKLFQRFARAKGAGKVNVTGTGLGLYVAKQMVEAHKGNIWAESEGEGTGTTFSVELPLIEEVHEKGTRSNKRKKTST